MSDTLARGKEFLKAAIASVYLVYLRFAGWDRRRVVLYYHGIRDDDAPLFARQMRFFSKFCSFEKATEILDDPEAKGLRVAITFDDAFLNLKRNAIPILSSLSIPASIFVPVGNLGEVPAWDMPPGSVDAQEPLMSVDDLREFPSEHVEVLSHTMTHPWLDSLDDAALERELAQSRMCLERWLGKPVTAISYPHGATDERVVACAKKAGYSMGFSIRPAILRGMPDRLTLGRTKILPTDGPIVSYLKMSGAYEILSLLKIDRGRRAGPC